MMSHPLFDPDDIGSDTISSQGVPVQAPWAAVCGNSNSHLHLVTILVGVCGSIVACILWEELDENQRFEPVALDCLACLPIFHEVGRRLIGPLQPFSGLW